MILRIRMADRTCNVPTHTQRHEIEYLNIAGQLLARANYDDGWRCFDDDDEAIMSDMLGTSAWPSLREFERFYFKRIPVIHLLGDPS